MTQTDEKVYKLVEDKWNKAYMALTPLFKKFNKIEDAYFGYLLPNQRAGSTSNVFDPIVLELIEHTASHLFSQLPEGSFFPTEPSDTFQVEIANEIVRFQMEKPEQHARKKLLYAGKTAFLFGYAFAITSWRYEREFHKGLKKWVTTWDDPYFEIPSIYDCWYDFEAANPWSLTYFGYDEYLTYDELEAQSKLHQGEERYKNLKELKDMVSDEATLLPNQYRSNALARRGIKTRTGDLNNRFLIRHYFDKKKWITVVPDYNIVIEDRNNPYPFALPVSILIDRDFPNLPVGTGEVEPIQSLAMAQNQFLNMRMDNVKNILEPPIKARESALRHSSTWIFKRNQIWTVNDQDDVQPFTFPDVTGGTFAQTTNFLESTILKRTGRTDFRSSDDLQDRTATEIKAMVGEQNAILRYKELNIDDFVSDIYVKFLMLNQLYLKKEREIRILGSDRIQKLEALYGPDVKVKEEVTLPDGRMEVQEVLSPLAGKFRRDGEIGWLRVDPSEIISMFDFRVESGSTKATDIANEVASLQSAISLLQSLQPLFQAKGEDINFRPLVEELLRNLRIKNIDKVFTAMQQQGGGSDDILNMLLNSDEGPEQQTVQSGAEATGAAFEGSIF